MGTEIFFFLILSNVAKAKNMEKQSLLKDSTKIGHGDSLYVIHRVDIHM